MEPSPSWYEPRDLEDAPDCLPELLTRAAGCGWWTATSELDDDNWQGRAG
jgi:hypothetical protein